MDSDTQRDAEIRRRALAGQSADEIAAALRISREAVFENLQHNSEQARAAYGRTYVIADTSHSLAVLNRLNPN